jgi:hypothetical protein
VSETIDRSSGQGGVVSGVVPAPSDSAGERPAVMGQDAEGVATLPSAIPTAIDGRRLDRPRRPRRAPAINGPGASTGPGALADDGAPPADSVSSARLALTVLELVDKHWSFAERTDADAKRELWLLARLVMLGGAALCWLAIAGGLFVSLVMVTERLTGSDPAPITAVLVSAAGASGISLAIRRRFGARR